MSGAHEIHLHDPQALELGASAGEIRAFALGGLARKLQIIGVPLDTL
jgi:hypothetical protein